MGCPSVHPIKRAESHLWLSRPSRRSAPSASRRTGGWLLPVLAAAIIFAPPFAPTAEAQTTLVSNVGQTRSGSLGLDTHEGAQAFTTGDNSAGYTVTSVGLDLSSGADHTINFTVAIWTNSNSDLPGSSLGDANATRLPDRGGQRVHDLRNPVGGQYNLLGCGGQYRRW